jgi:2-polyprenyl-6-methoxyphenol hydroxylase-like FAD-dependent oxidoreductase
MLVETPEATRQVDVAIVGGGLSGSLAAVILGRKGYRVALLDRHAKHPPEFRAEKIAGPQVGVLQRLGLLDCALAVSTPFNEVVNARHGRIIDRTHSPHLGFFYHDLVNAVRAQLPASVEFIAGQVTDVQTSKDFQRVELADGTSIGTRLIVLATGLHDVIRRKLGVTRNVLFEKHSITFGFNVAAAPGMPFEFPALTCYGEQLSDRIDYINIFPIGSVMRANLFTFRDHRDPWLREIRHEPEKTLLNTIPGMKPFLGAFHIASKVENWAQDLYVVDNYVRNGVVLIGDAFQTSCPAAGTGVGRLLIDVDQLCNLHLPRWLETPGMESSKIAQFYSDPVKQKSDGRSQQLARYRRSLTIDDSWKWEAYRLQATVRRQLVGFVKEFRLLRSSWQTSP